MKRGPLKRKYWGVRRVGEFATAEHDPGTTTVYTHATRWR
jgi:hypothetical protein